MATTPQKELRNQVAEAPRRVEACETMTTAVAGPWVSGAELVQLWRAPTPRGLDHDLLTLGAVLIDPFDA